MSRRAPERTWSDQQLADAIRASTSWRGVMRALGLKATSAGAIRVVRRRAAELGLEASHFRGKRRWSDAQLKVAVPGARCWDELLTNLGLEAGSGSARTFIKGHAIRLGLDYSHLEPPTPAQAESCALRPDLRHLREAGPSIAAAWFTLCGCAVSLPVEPATFDLLTSTPDGIKQVQVKTTTCPGKGSWQVQVGRRPYSEGNLAPRTPYDPEVIDFFFVIDGELNMYLIPSRVIAGRVAILLRTYTAYIVGNAGGLLAAAAAPDAASP